MLRWTLAFAVCLMCTYFYLIKFVAFFSPPFPLSCCCYWFSWRIKIFINAKRLFLWCLFYGWCILITVPWQYLSLKQFISVSVSSQPNPCHGSSRVLAPASRQMSLSRKKMPWPHHWRGDLIEILHGLSTIFIHRNIKPVANKQEREKKT